MTATYNHTTFTARPEPHIQIGSDLFFIQWQFYQQKHSYTQRWYESIYFLKSLLFRCHCLKKLKVLLLQLTCNVWKKEKSSFTVTSFYKIYLFLDHFKVQKYKGLKFTLVNFFLSEFIHSIYTFHIFFQLYLCICITFKCLVYFSCGKVWSNLLWISPVLKK